MIHLRNLSNKGAKKGVANVPSPPCSDLLPRQKQLNPNAYGLAVYFDTRSSNHEVPRFSKRIACHAGRQHDNARPAFKAVHKEMLNVYKIQ